MTVNWSKELDEKVKFQEFFPEPEDADFPEDGKWSLWGIAIAAGFSLAVWTLLIRGVMWVTQFAVRYLR